MLYLIYCFLRENVLPGLFRELKELANVSILIIVMIVGMMLILKSVVPKLKIPVAKSRRKATKGINKVLAWFGNCIVWLVKKIGEFLKWIYTNVKAWLVNKGVPGWIATILAALATLIVLAIII